MAHSAARDRSMLPADMVLVDNGMAFEAGRDWLDFLWFKLIEHEAGCDYPLYRVARLKLLRYLPQEARQDAGLLDTMRTALTGLYNQRVSDYDPCMLVAGIFDPPLGVVQCYGAVGVAEELEQAARNAALGMGAVEGVMANFPQSRLEPLDIQKAEWLRQAFLEMSYSMVIIGQPDPRLSARGMGREGPAEKSTTMTGETAYTLQQNEMLFRALARLEEEFLFLVLASRLAQRDLATMLEGVASEASTVASRQTGAKSISFGLSFPLMASGGLGQSAGSNYGRSEGESITDGIAESETDTHTVGTARTTGYAVTDGTAHTVGHATSAGSSTSTSITVTEGTNEGTADTVGSAHTAGSSTSSGGSSSFSTSSNVTHVPTITSESGADPTNPPHSISLTTPPSTVSSGSAYSEGTPAPSRTDSFGRTDSVNLTMEGMGATYSAQYGTANSAPTGQSTEYTRSGSVSSPQGVLYGGPGTVDTRESLYPAALDAIRTGDMAGLPPGVGVSADVSAGRTLSTTPAHAITSNSNSFSSGSFSSTTHSSADTSSQSHTASQGSSQSVARTTATSSFSSSTSSVADTTSHSETRSTATTDSQADSHAEGLTLSHGIGRTSGTNISRALGVARMMGMSAGVVPSVSAAKSYQWWDDKAVQLTQILRAQEELLRQATLEGAWLTDAYMLCRTERGVAAAEAAVRQAFHGSQLPVVTPVQTRRLTQDEQSYIRLHAMAFTPSTREETVAGALEAYKDSTLLLPLQLAAYMSPGLFEEGVSVTVAERTPSFSFVPDMRGDVILGHLWSTETGRLTSAQLRLSEERMFHTAFAADTGFGKTVAAERLAVETAVKWKYRTVVLDFGAGWRRMLNAPLGESGRVEVWQVFPGAEVPIRWNPLQIGKRVDPERQMRATCELMRNAGRMGPRQLGFMRRALKKMYLDHGVLISYREVLSDEQWNVVQDSEWEELERAALERNLEPRRREAGLSVENLRPFERQALAVHRSKRVSLAMWYEELNRMFERLRPGTPDHTSLEGVLLRVEPFCEGEMERMYGRGEGCMAIEDLGLLGPASDPWGISVLEGGAEMDEFAKAVVFSLVAWHLYNDAVVRRRLSIGCMPQRKLQIFFEEANKVLGGVAVDRGDDEEGSGGISDLWLQMWRDGRKYGVWLHVIAQTVSELPNGILSSCNNAFYSQTKNPRDRDLIMAHLAFSEKGFTDEDYKRFLSRMPVAQAVCKLGYSDDVMHTTPLLCRPALVPAQEPTDAELLAFHLAMEAAKEGHQPVTA